MATKKKDAANAEGLQLLEGKCRYCDTLLSVMAVDQEDADNMSTEQCTCAGSMYAGVERSATALIDQLFVDDDPDAHWAPASTVQVGLIRRLATAVIHCDILGATVNLGTTQAKIVAGKSSPVMISRKFTTEMSLEAVE
ncbi:MAG: hypothetical protein LBQ21_07585 [Clostridiales Family XIII bacterium]|jgi:hypothetical protein|nr:hypothetical protein [Clostridiales Family XIII bacterium]